MKDEFNEGLLYITHFVVLYPFLGRPQILLKFTRHSKFLLGFAVQIEAKLEMKIQFVKNVPDPT